VTLSEILTLIKGVLQFPQAVLSLIQILKKTPSEKHDELIKKMADEAAHFQSTGRPTWD